MITIREDNSETLFLEGRFYEESSWDILSGIAEMLAKRGFTIEVSFGKWVQIIAIREYKFRVAYMINPKRAGTGSWVSNTTEALAKALMDTREVVIRNNDFS